MCFVKLVEKEAEITRLKSYKNSELLTDRAGEVEKARAAQLQAERLLEAKEQSYRQQISRLENQVGIAF